MLLKEVLESSIDKRASDIHLIAGKKVCIRINGILMEHNASKVLTALELEKIVSEILDEEQLSVLKEEQSILLASNLYNLGRFRVNVSTQRGSYCISIKIAANIDDIKDIEIHNVIKKLHTLKEGLILISGPYASGKSVTCAKLIEEINDNYCRTIATIENPIAFLTKHKQSIVKQKEVGLDVKSHKEGLHSAMLDDSDVIMIDDVREAEVLQMAIKASEKGKIVIACLPAADAKSALKYVVEAVQKHQMPLRRMELSQVLKAVVSHKMIIDEDGKRIPLYEIVINSTAIKRLIIEDKLDFLPKVVDSHRDMGMMTFDHHLVELINNGVIEKEKGLSYSSENIQISKLLDRGCGKS